MKTLRTAFLAGLLLAAAPVLAAKKPVDVSHPVNANASVKIDNLAGSVKIVGWNKNMVHVTGTLGSTDLNLEVSGDKDSLVIRVVYPDMHGDHGNRNEPGSDLVVQLPQGAAVEADTVSATVAAGGVSGSQHLQSVSGDITVESKASDIDAQSVSGNVEVKGSAAAAHVEMDTVSGSAHASGVSGELTGQTVSGNVTVDGGRLSRATLNATSGRAEFNSPVEAGGHYKFNTVSGRIVLNLPQQPDAEFDITTFSGSIENSFGPEPEKVSEYTSSLKLHFTSGKGGAYVEANSMAGEIVLKAGH